MQDKDKEIEKLDKDNKFLARSRKLLSEIAGNATYKMDVGCEAALKLQAELSKVKKEIEKLKDNKDGGYL